MVFVLWHDSVATSRDLDKKRPASGCENGDNPDGDEEVSSLSLAPRHLHPIASRGGGVKRHVFYSQFDRKG